MQTASATELKALREIPGVGKSIAIDLWQLGVHRVEDLVSRDPEMLYEDLCILQGVRVDRCMLYVFRCAVYYATCRATDTLPDPEKLKWWYWKEFVATLATTLRSN